MFGFPLLYLVLAALAGLSMAVQGSLNAVLGKKTGILEASFIVHFTAVIVLLIFILINLSKINIPQWRKIPWYLYLGGLLGVIISYTVIITIPKLGVAVATTAIITAQVLTASFIDHFGIFGLEEIPFTWIKLVGVFFLAAGVRLLLHN
ncbi:MAG: DMT family transporter [Firmicutes bacterium]|nr:DMT family transporter [Bacillota bacterium]